MASASYPLPLVLLHWLFDLYKWVFILPTALVTANLAQDFVNIFGFVYLLAKCQQYRPLELKKQFHCIVILWCIWYEG